MRTSLAVLFCFTLALGRCSPEESPAQEWSTASEGQVRHPGTSAACPRWLRSTRWSQEWRTATS